MLNRGLHKVVLSYFILPIRSTSVISMCRFRGQSPPWISVTCLNVISIIAFAAHFLIGLLYVSRFARKLVLEEKRFTQDRVAFSPCMCFRSRVDKVTSISRSRFALGILGTFSVEHPWCPDTRNVLIGGGCVATWYSFSSLVRRFKIYLFLESRRLSRSLATRLDVGLFHGSIVQLFR